MTTTDAHESTGEAHEPCGLQYSAGRIEECPGAACPFWDEQAAACIFHPVKLELLRSPALAAHLLELRRELDQGRHDGSGKEAQRSLFYRLLEDEPAAE